MKKIVLTTAALFIINGAACALFTPKNIKTVLDIAQMTCIIANEYRNTPVEVAHACHVAEELIPEVDKMLQAHKAAAKMKASASPSASTSASATATCPPSASAPPPPPSTSAAPKASASAAPKASASVAAAPSTAASAKK